MAGIFFLLDECVPEHLADDMIRLEPAIEVIQVGQEFAPRKGTKDPQLLLFAEANQMTFVTRDKKTMPGHLRQHFQAGHHTWGVYMLRPGFPTARYAENLVLIWSCLQKDDVVDLSDYLPW